MGTSGMRMGRGMPTAARHDPWRQARHEELRYRPRDRRLQRAWRSRRDERNIERYWLREEEDIGYGTEYSSTFG